MITEANQYRAKAIILATGSSMQKLGVPGEDRFVGRGVSYYAKRNCDQFLGKKVLVIGGGNSAAKSALLAKTNASQVILVHRRESLRAYPAMTQRLQKEGIEVWYNTEVKEIKGHNKVEAAVVMNNKTGEQKEIPLDWLVICLGTVPNTKLAQEAGIEMEGKFVKVDNHMRTNIEGIFACGEIIPGPRHLITSASQGASAGIAVSEYLALQMVKRGKCLRGPEAGNMPTNIWQCSARLKQNDKVREVSIRMANAVLGAKQDRKVNRLKRALQTFLIQDKLTPLLAQTLAQACKWGELSYDELKEIAEDDSEDLLLLGFQWKLLLPTRSAKGTLEWGDVLLLPQPGEVYKMPNVIKCLVEEAIQTGQWNVDRAIVAAFKSVGEPEPGKMPKLVQRLGEESRDYMINAVQIEKICRELGLENKVNSLIAELKGSGVLSPKVGSLTEVIREGSPLYELNPSLFVSKVRPLRNQAAIIISRKNLRILPGAIEPTAKPQPASSYRLVGLKK